MEKVLPIIPTEDVKSFIDACSKKERAYIDDTIISIMKEGYANSMRSEVLKKLRGEEVYQIKIPTPERSFRIQGGLYRGKLILAHAFVKKSNNTPLREIETTKRKLANIDYNLIK